MSNEVTPEQLGDAAENQPAGDSQVFTQDQVNVLVGNARKKERAKYENFEKYKADSERLAEIEEANKSELEKALSRAEQAETELAALKQAKQKKEWKEAVSKETGVPVAVLNGDTEEEIRACAESLKEYFPNTAKPYVGSDGFAPTNDKGKSTREQFAEALAGF